MAERDEQLERIECMSDGLWEVIEGEKICDVIPSLLNVLYGMLNECECGCVSNRISNCLMVIGEHHPQLLKDLEQGLIDKSIRDALIPKDTIPTPTNGTIN